MFEELEKRILQLQESVRKGQCDPAAAEQEINNLLLSAALREEEVR